MAFKFVVLATLLAAANAGLIAGPAASSYSSVSQGHSVAYAPALKVAAPIAHYSAPLAHYAAPVAHYAAPVAHYAAPVAHYAAPAAQYAKTILAEPIAHPKYDFAYSVHDGHTGDVKNQQESRDGDAVHGSYSLVEPDGTKRIVEYTADDHNGFNAVVHREPASHPVAVKAIAPVLKYAAPLAVKTYAAAPVYQTAPALGHYSYH